MTSLRSVNLNLLPILQAILRRRNITRAAEELNMSQSAVSDALSRLRHLFDDKLLVREGRKMALTNYALGLLPRIDTAIEDIGRLMGRPHIDPATIKRRFLLATADSVMSNIGPAILRAVQEEAPLADFQFVTLIPTIQRAAQASRVDLMIGPAQMWEAEDGFWRDPLYEEHFVCIMRSGHPLAGTPLTADAYWSAPHASYRPDHQAVWTLEVEFMRAARRTQREVVRVPHFALLPRFVETSDCLALMSKRLALRLEASHDIVIRELPFETAKVQFYEYWTGVHHNDPEHRWFRELVAREARGVAASLP